MSDQRVVGCHLESGAGHLTRERISVRGAVVPKRRGEIEACKLAEGFGDRDPHGRRERIGSPTAKLERSGAGRLGAGLYDVQCVLDDRVVTLVHPVPFQHGEFWGIQVAALAVSIDGRKRENLPFARGQQLLAGEFRRGVKVERPARAVGRDLIGRKGMEMGLVSGRDLKGRALHLGKSFSGEIGPRRLAYASTRHQQRPAIGMDGFVPPGRALDHGRRLRPKQPWPLPKHLL